MWSMSSSCLALATIVLFCSLHQGVTGQSACRLVLSQNSQSLAVRIGSIGEVKCQISPECNLTQKRVLGPFWKQPDGKWFTPTMRMTNVQINTTTIALQYIHIIHEDFGIYLCVARVGRERLTVAANFSERQGNQGDVKVTLGPQGTTRRPQKKKRSVVESFKSFIGFGVADAATPSTNHRERRESRRSLQGQTRDSRQGNPPRPDYHPAASNHGNQLLKTPCDDEKEKLFSKTGIIIVAALVCSTFLLLYMVVLLMAVPRICFPYYPKKDNGANKDERSADSSKDKESSTKVDIPLSLKVRQNGRSDSGIESVDGLEERGSHHGGGRTESHWEIGTDKLEEFYRRTSNQETGSDEDMLSGLKKYNIGKDVPRRGRSESVPVTPYRFQSSIYVNV